MVIHSCIGVIEHLGIFNIVGLIGTHEKFRTNVWGASNSTDSDLPQLVTRYKHAIITVGQIETPIFRHRLFEQALGFKLPAIISPTANVSRNAVVEEATIVMQVLL